MSLREQRNEPTTGIYLAGETSFFAVCSLAVRSSTLDSSFGALPFTICLILGPNSRRRLIPAPLPIVEPKLLKVAEEDLAQYGRYAVCIATEVITARKYDVFSLLFPASLRVMKRRETASVARLTKLSLVAG